MIRRNPAHVNTHWGEEKIEGGIESVTSGTLFDLTQK